VNSKASYWARFATRFENSRRESGWIDSADCGGFVFDSVYSGHTDDVPRAPRGAPTTLVQSV